MESLKSVDLLEFHPDTLSVVRKTFGLENESTLNEAIDLLDKWCKEQEHFTKKNFSRGYLERSLIRSKGSVMKTKERLDKMMSTRTLKPRSFQNIDVRDIDVRDVNDAFLPKLTKDYYRIYMSRDRTQKFRPGHTKDFCVRMAYFFEYVCAHDYNNGMIVIIDNRNLNAAEFLKSGDINDVVHLVNLVINSYGLRVKSIHIISDSKVLSFIVNTVKQFLSKKIGSRVQVHNNLETLYKYVDKEILPEEYGGGEKSLTELHKNWLDLLASDKHREYMKEMNAAKTIEEKRTNKSSSGLFETFKKLSFD